MGRIAVIYDSLTGNTRRMAELVAEGARRLPGMEVSVRGIEEPDAAEIAVAADGIALGCQALNTVLMNFGFLVFGLTDYVGKATSAHYGAMAVREPRDEDVRESCRKLGERLAEWVGAFIDRDPAAHPLVREPGRKRPGS